MLMKNRILAICILSIPNLWASVPTTEGLFRNNNNSDVQASLVMVTLQADKTLNQEVLEQTPEQAPVTEKEVVKPELEQKVNVKYLFSVNDKDDVELIRVLYKPGKMDDQNVIGVKYYKNLIRGIVNSSDERGLVMSLFSSLALNRSNEISAFLKKNSKNYRSNQELVDPEKRDLYLKYKKYLKLVKEDESLKESLDNPMEPKDPEVRKTVEAIKSRTFLQRDPHVTLEKENNHFLWKVDLDVLQAIFDGKNQRLMKIDFKKPGEEIKVNLDDYILFNGTNELPKIIEISDSTYTYTLRTSSQVQLNLGSKSMERRYSEYLDKLKQNGEVQKIDFNFL